MAVKMKEFRAIWSVKSNSFLKFHISINEQVYFILSSFAEKLPE